VEVSVSYLDIPIIKIKITLRKDNKNKRMEKGKYL